MATLKNDLDEYLLQNDKRSYKISLPTFSTPTFFTRNNDATPSSSNSQSWFEEVQKDYCTLSRTQRFIGFGICLFLGILCFFMSFLLLPVLLVYARKFSLLFTLGSLFFLLSFSFLYGPWNHLKSLFSKERALATVMYGATLIATLYCALHLGSTLLTVLCAIAQVVSLIWMMMGSVPGGSSGVRFFGSMFKSSVSNTLPI
ncbi:uncharacterized protein LOC128672305 [Plodia interpunctella]|uniref:uncharacterized protein LOC128672305 n=1 Tax=Plodia interpunctella TaxID=58824 RepID=UPI0023675788|nr:uncharacterized protein LOC128672305 [Plodia interpunctella]